MYLLNASRTRLLTLLPKGGCVAEIGVAWGGFAERIRTITEPEQLHLIDPWERFHKTPADTARFGGQREAVLQKFAADIDTGRVVVHPTFSTEAASEFSDALFSWIYVDGAHDYDNVLGDLRALASKVRPDGFILGHDYSRNPKNSQQGFGVVQAVNDFTAESDWRLVALTQESAPTFVLVRAHNTTTWPHLCKALEELPTRMVEEIPDEALDSYSQIERTRADGKRVYVVQFGASRKDDSVHHPDRDAQKNIEARDGVA